MKKKHTPFVLIILDGWGHSTDTKYNAILQAHTPCWDHLWATCPQVLLDGAGRAVGLPHGQMGNSEVGHLNIGAGRMVAQDYTRITQAIETGTFDSNPVLSRAIEKTKANAGRLHLMGLLSEGGVHSHESHLHALIKLAAKQGIKDVAVHAFLDGRDTPPKSAHASLERLTQLLETLKVGRIASLIGRYYAMDRDQRWDRTQKAYDLITGKAADYQADTAIAGLNAAYLRNETDEFVRATQIGTPIPLQENDTLLYFNFRADRARQLTQAFVDPNFSHFNHMPIQLATFVTLTEYAKTLPTDIVYAPEKLNNTLGEYLAKQHYRQLRIAETEKYAHVTFFFNGGIELPFAGERRELIPSPEVKTYDLQPQMNAPLLTDTLIKAIHQQDDDVIICNYANADMVGHTGDLIATKKAIETLDTCVHRITQALAKVGGELLITADHGNAEQMHDAQTNQPHTAHTCNPVPLVYIGKKGVHCTKETGTLADIAPTLLHLLGLPIPAEMTGDALFKRDKSE